MRPAAGTRPADEALDRALAFGQPAAALARRWRTFPLCAGGADVNAGAGGDVLESAAQAAFFARRTEQQLGCGA
jgi:hypothetical protein